jgi:hypothetical protein
MEKAWLGVDAGKESSTGLTCSTLPDKTVALPEGRKRREADISALIDDQPSRSPRRLTGQSRPARRWSGTLAGALVGTRSEESSTSLASAWIGPATPTAASPSPMPAMLASSPTRRGCEGRPREALKAGEQELAELQSFCSLAAATSLPTRVENHHSPQRGPCLTVLPALERALDLNSKGPLTLLTHY